MNTQLIDRFLAACGTATPLALRLYCPGWREPVVRSFHQPFVVAGREAQADLCLDAAGVSPQHAYFQVIAGSVFCVDLQSETGTRWPGREERSGWLDGGEPVQIGPFSVQLALDAEADPEAFGGPKDWNPLLSRSAQVSRLPSVTLELLNTVDRQPPRPINRLLALVGSAPGCHIRLSSSTVARFQCALLRTPLGLWVVDLLGSEGVRVNGAAPRYALLKNGDELQLGRFRLRVGYELPASTVAASTESRLPVEHAINGHARKQPATAAPEPRHAHADLATASLTELALVRQDEPLLPALVQQFQLMQQQMFDQFQQSMLSAVQMFGQLHRKQADQIRRDLERIQGMTQELQTF